MSFVKCDLFINVGAHGDDEDEDDGDGGDWRFLSINSVGLDLSQHHWK